MKTRIISGVVLTALAILTGVLGGPVLQITLLLCSEIGLEEFLRATGVIKEGEKRPAIVTAAYIDAIIYYCALYVFADRAVLLLPLTALLLMVILAVYVLSFPKYQSKDVIATCFGFFYVVVMLGFMYLTREEENGLIIVWLIYLSSWGADTAAYFAGRFLGKHKMAPVLSPKKTVEGAVGGILGAGIFGLLFALVFNGGNQLVEFFIICAAGAVISIFGDLTASAIKRDNGIKDYGKLIPGHGGILDRFDSVIFTAPVIYFLSQLLITLR